MLLFALVAFLGADCLNEGSSPRVDAMSGHVHWWGALIMGTVTAKGWAGKGLGGTLADMVSYGPGFNTINPESHLAAQHLPR